MQHGTRPTRFDHRDYDFVKSFGSVVPPQFPDQYFTDPRVWFPDQVAEGMPYGCTDYTQTQLANDLAQGAPYIPPELEAATHANQLGGVDVRTSLKAALALGWIQRFFNVRPVHLDMFDSIRFAMYTSQPEQRSVSVGTIWYPEWEATTADILPLPANLYLSGPWHNWAIIGWETLNGTPYLVGKSWQGTKVGKGGLQYFSREVFNAALSVPGTVAFTASDLTPLSIQTIDTSLVQWIVSWARHLLGYN